MKFERFPSFVAHPGSLRKAVPYFQEQQVQRLFLLADPFMVSSGMVDALLDDFAAADMDVTLFHDFTGEPKLTKMDDIIALTRAKKCDGVMGIGGGSALDMAKIVSITLVADRPADDYWMMANPLPAKSLPSIMVPTTAGTGSETCSTNIIANRQGHKGWVWGPETKPDLILFDAELGKSLPAALTGWCGMDAFIHAFESSTNNYTHDDAKAYGHHALKLAVDALPKVLANGDDLEARQDMLIASACGGAAIDQVGTAIAHQISHAMASLAPIHHGHATAIGFEITLGWILEGDLSESAIANFQQVADLFGLADYKDLPQFVTDFMDRCQIDRRLPASFADFDKAELLKQLLADHTQSMRNATVREASEADLAQMVEAIAALPVMPLDH